MWKGSVSFGLVNVPVKMYTATSSKDVSFHQVHKEDGGRIKYRRICSVCGEEVAFSDIGKGYESPDGQLVILGDDDLAALPVAGSREIDVDRFIPAEQVDPMLLEKSYYLEPEKSGRKAYALLREVLAETDRMALVKVAIRQRSTLAVLRVREDPDGGPGVIVMQTMMWPDEIRVPEFDDLPGDDDLRPQEIAMAESLVDSMTGEYVADDFSDDYREAVEALVASKLGDAPAAPEPEAAPADGGEVIDLLAALQRSVDAAKATRAAKTSGGDSDAADDGSGADQPAAKKTAAKKGATKKSAAKKTTAKKAPAKKAAKKAG